MSAGEHESLRCCRREPVAELGAEDYRVVKHTHDVALAERLMREAVAKDRGLELHEVGTPGRPVAVWLRVQPCLPNSYGAGEGWSYAFHPTAAGARGAFRAVEFR